MTVQQQALVLARMGLPVFPIARNTKDGILQADWARGGATTDLMEVWDTFAGEARNIGVLATGHVILDVDCKGHANGFDALRVLDIPETFKVATPSGGLHIYFDAKGEKYGQRDLAPGINVRANNGYVLGPGSVFEEKPYVIQCASPIAPVPMWLAERLREAPQRSLSAGQVVGELDTPAAIESARAWLSSPAAPLAVEGAGGDNTTYKVACFVLDRGVAPETALQLMLDHWNDRCSPPWDPEDLEAKIHNAAMYRQAAVGRDNPAGGFVPVDLATLQPARRSRSYWIEDEPLDASVPWLIDEAVQRGGIGFLAGTSGSGKTFLAVHLALCGVTGTPYFGRKMTERFGTFVIAAEGAHSIPQRVRAAAIHAFGLKPEDAGKLPIVYSKGAPDLMTKPGLADCIEELKCVSEEMRSRYGVPLGLVIADTFGQTFNLDDENSSAHVNRATKIMQAIASATGATVTPTHHFGHVAERIRGSSAFRANVDFVIEARKDGELFLEKCRDAAEVRLGWYSLPIVTVGSKADGRPITSRFVQEITEQCPRPDAAAGFTAVKSCRDFDDAYNGVVTHSPENRAEAPVAAVKAAFFSSRDGTQATKRQAWNRALKRAMGCGYQVEGEIISKPLEA